MINNINNISIMNNVYHLLLPITSLLLTPLAALHAADAPRPAGKPNIIFIVVDDLGSGELGCYGGKDIPTPQIDSLAASGARFASGYVTAPFYAASRAALITGRYQTRFGFEFNPIGVNQGKEICGAYYVSVRRLDQIS